MDLANVPLLFVPAHPCYFSADIIKPINGQAMVAGWRLLAQAWLPACVITPPTLQCWWTTWSQRYKMSLCLSGQCKFKIYWKMTTFARWIHCFYILKWIKPNTVIVLILICHLLSPFSFSFTLWTSPLRQWSPEEELLLSKLTFIGCGASLCAMVVTLMMFTVLEWVPSEC